MPSSPQVSVALPISGDSSGLSRAFDSVQHQTLAEIEILLIPNGADAATLALVDRLARSDDRVRVIRRDEAGLPAALNQALDEAAAPLVARMDADDTCSPDRLARQVVYMDTHPEIAVLATAWEVVDAGGRVLYTLRPPTDPRRLRWKLLTANQLAHGSVMLRRDHVLDMGGYDENCFKAQDYDLWLRASNALAVAALPDVLYRYTARETQGLATSHEQALVAANAMLDAWQQMPPSPSASAPESQTLADLIASAILDDDQTAMALEQLDQYLDQQGPTREAMLAHLWLTSRKPPATREAINICRLSRLREVGKRIRDAGTNAVWLFGAGSHSARLIENLDELGLVIEGIVDDALAGQTRFGFEIRPPSSLSSGQTLLISSDAHEEKMWRATLPLRETGVRVVRLYAD